MHELVLYIAAVWAVLLLGAGAFVIVRAPSAVGRVLIVDTLGLILIAVLALFAALHREAVYLDVALVLALLAFVGTLAAARYFGAGRVFS